MIEPQKVTIGSILERSAVYQVPEYQRAFDWGLDEASNLFGDLQSSMEPKNENLFIGTLVFQYRPETQETYHVVDGQQRLTTILLLLLACKRKVSIEGRGGVAQEIQRKITPTDEATGRSLGCRLVASDSIRALFEQICRDDWDGTFPANSRKQTRKLKPMFDFFLGQIAPFDEEKMTRFLRAIYGTYAIRIDLKTDSDAFILFERTNARGLELEASDLLKNYLFSAKAIDTTKWESIVDNSRNSLLPMLRSFYTSQLGSAPTKDLYQRLRKYGEKLGPLVLEQELEKFSVFYRKIRTAEKADDILEYFKTQECRSIYEKQERYTKVFRAFQGLQLFNVRQVLSVLYASYQCFCRLGGSENDKLAKRLIGLFEVLEKYHFINNMICTRIGNFIEETYSDYCKKFKDVQSIEAFVKVMDELIAKLKEMRADEDEFVTQFKQIAHTQNLPLIYYIFDRFENYDMFVASYKNLYMTDMKVLRKMFSIEHIYPQHPDDQPGRSCLPEEVIHNIGNLVAVPFALNSHLGNKLPEVKMKLLQTDYEEETNSHRILRDLVHEYNNGCWAKYEGNGTNGSDKKSSKSSGSQPVTWDQRLIERRGKALAIEGYNTVWKF